MSLGHGYDMVLLPPRHPTDHDYGLSQRGGALRWNHRSRQTRAARRRHDQRSCHHRPEEGDTMLCSDVPRPDAHAASLVGDLCRMSLVVGETPAGHPVIPPSGTAPLAGSGSVSPAAGTMPPWTFPFGLNTAAQRYASSISTNMGAYEELPGHHLRSALDLVASTPASEYQDSTETPGTEYCVIASRRYDPRDRRPHMHPS
jgi:hypothetical protein